MSCKNTLHPADTDTAAFSLAHARRRPKLAVVLDDHLASRGQGSPVGRDDVQVVES